MIDYYYKEFIHDGASVGGLQFDSYFLHKGCLVIHSYVFVLVVQLVVVFMEVIKVEFCGYLKCSARGCEGQDSTRNDVFQLLVDLIWPNYRGFFYRQKRFY